MYSTLYTVYSVLYSTYVQCSMYSILYTLTLQYLRVRVNYEVLSVTSRSTVILLSTVIFTFSDSTGAKQLEAAEHCILANQMLDYPLDHVPTSTTL